MTMANDLKKLRQSTKRKCEMHFSGSKGKPVGVGIIRQPGGHLAYACPKCVAKYGRS